jgi:hypothetical protein
LYSLISAKQKLLLKSGSQVGFLKTISKTIMELYVIRARIQCPTCRMRLFISFELMNMYFKIYIGPIPIQSDHSPTQKFVIFAQFRHYFIIHALRIW